MKIGFVITNIAFSGAQNVFNAVTKELHDRGNDIFVFTTNENEDLELNGIKVYGLGNLCSQRIMNQCKKVVKMKELTKQLQLDAMVAFGFNSNIKAIMAGMISRVPVVISDRMDPRSFPAHNNYLLRLERWFFYRFASCLCVQTNEIKEFYNKKIQRKTHIVPNPVRDVTHVCVAEMKRSKIIITITRMDEAQKNLKHLLESFKLFSAKHPEYKLQLIGGGPDQKMLEEYAAKLGIDDKTEFTGNVSDPKEYLKDADIFTLVSYHEGMPNALIEAMSMGLPCVVEHFGGGAAEELIEHGVNGILLPRHDAHEWSEAVNDLANDEQKKAMIGRNAYSINDSLSMTRIGDLWLNAIRMACGRGKIVR